MMRLSSNLFAKARVYDRIVSLVYRAFQLRFPDPISLLLTYFVTGFQYGATETSFFDIVRRAETLKLPR